MLVQLAVLALKFAPCQSSAWGPPFEDGETVKTGSKKNAKKDPNGFGKDRRRKHHHYLVTIAYADGERFGRVYTDKDKADRFAERQRRSPVVKSARVSQVS
jgi:hypothetical protein